MKSELHTNLRDSSSGSSLVWNSCALQHNECVGWKMTKRQAGERLSNGWKANVSQVCFETQWGSGMLSDMINVWSTSARSLLLITLSHILCFSKTRSYKTFVFVSVLHEFCFVHMHRYAVCIFKTASSQVISYTSSKHYTYLYLSKSLYLFCSGEIIFFQAIFKLWLRLGCLYLFMCVIHKQRQHLL